MKGISELLNIEEYLGNSYRIEIKNKKRKSDFFRKTTLSQPNSFMMNAPNPKQEMSYRVKTPNGNFVYYYENEAREPFLIDKANNIWIWEGVDIKNPIDDWLVRTPEGEVYNYFINEYDQLIQRLIGNERDLEMLLNNNISNKIDSLFDP